MTAMVHGKGSSSSSSSSSSEPNVAQKSLKTEEEMLLPTADESSAASSAFSRGRIVAMAICIAGSYFVWGLIFSVQPPFYPSEAEKKGAKPSQYGFVFGIAHLAAFVSAPIFATQGNRIGPKLLYTVGSFMQCICGGLAFGFLDFVSGTGLFLGLSYMLRFLYGVADAASFGAVLGILISIWPDKVASIMSWTETFFGLGYSIGPALGSFLYQIGGFQLPFYVVGCVGLAFAVCLPFVVPKVDSTKREKKPEKKPLIPSGGKGSLTVKGVFSNPSIWFPYVDNVVLQCGYGFVESMLEPHAKDDAGFTQLQVGWAFLIMGAFYMMGAPLVGYACDHVSFPVVFFSVCGNVCICLAMMLIGPAPFFPADVLPPSVPLIYAAMVLEGLAYAFNMVSTFSRAGNAAKRLGYRDDINTYLMVTGMWTTSFYLGNFIGPTMAGLLVEGSGFAVTSSIFMGVYMLMIVLDTTDFFLQKKSRQREGYEQLN